MELSDALKAQLAAKLGGVEEETPDTSDATTRSRVAMLVEKVTGEEDVTSFAELDSLDRIEIVVRAEQEFKVELGDEDVAKLKTLDELSAYIDKLLV